MVCQTQLKDWTLKSKFKASLLEQMNVQWGGGSETGAGGVDRGLGLEGRDQIGFWTGNKDLQKVGL